MTGSPGTTPVAPTDRVSDVIARDEALVDVFVRAAPHFTKLRNRAMRRVMARLITVEQAARTAGIPAEKLVSDLNSALGIVERAADATVSGAGQSEMAKGGALPGPGGPGQPGGEVRDAADVASPTRPAGMRVRELDVREDLRTGNEPFSKIMAAVAALGEDEMLRLRTTFEPVPLFTVLGKRGFVHESEEHGAEDWSVWFWRPVAPAIEGSASGDAAAVRSSDGAGSSASTATTRATDTSSADVSSAAPRGDASTADVSDSRALAVDGITVDDRTIVLDVRGLNPPEPLMRTLTALETLPEGHQLLQINARVPQFLFPMLAERGFACDVDESRADRVLVRIWRPA